MSSVKPCKCGNPSGHAHAVESGVFQSLRNAQTEPDRESYWRSHADRLENNFTAAHGQNYSTFLGARP